jgi:hypothetical protein
MRQPYVAVVGAAIATDEETTWAERSLARGSGAVLVCGLGGDGTRPLVGAGGGGTGRPCRVSGLEPAPTSR